MTSPSPACTPESHTMPGGGRALHPIPEVSLSCPALLLSGNEHGADSLSLLVRSPIGKGESALQPQKSRREGDKVLCIPILEARKVPEGRSQVRDPRPVSEPLLLFTWPDVAEGPLGKPFGARSWVPPFHHCPEDPVP